MEQDELFLLIKALSKNEKKFFTRYTNLYEDKGSPVYQKLFDFLNNEDTYDEEKIFKKFRNKNFKKNYPVIKHYLKNLIIKTLRHSELTVKEDRDLTVYVLDVKRLMAKGLFPMAKKMIERLKAEAYADEKFYDTIHFIAMQRGLISMGYYRYEPEVNLDALDEEEELILAKAAELRKVINADFKIYSLMSYELPVLPEEVVKQIHQLGKQKCLSDFDALLSAKAKHTFLHFWASYYCALGNFKKYLECAEQRLKFVKMENLPSGAAVNWLILAHNHCLSAESLNGITGRFEEHIDFLEKMELKSSFHDSERFQTIAQFGILYYTKYFDEKKLDHYIRYSKEGLTRLAPFIRKAFVYVLRTSIAYAYLKMKRLDDCWKEVNDLMSLTNGESRKDFHGHVRLINLMLRYEMKEYKYVAYLLKSTYRFFATYLFTTPVHKFMIGYLKEAMKTNKAEELAALNKQYLQILGNLRFDPSQADLALVRIAEDYLASPKG